MARKLDFAQGSGCAPRVFPPAGSDGAPLEVTVVLLEGGYASTAIGPIEVFHSAGLLWNQLQGDAAEPRFRVRSASLDGASVPSACALALTPSLALEEVRRSDIVIVAASGLDLDAQLARHAALLPWLRTHHARGAWILGICTGVTFLAESGLLDGRRATTHWAVAEELRQRYPAVAWCPEEFVTEDGRILCGGGVYSAIDLSLYLVERICGHEIALQCARSLLVSMPRSRQSGYAVLPLSRPHGDARIRAAEEYLQQHYDRELSTQVLAERVGLAPRTFIRRFKAATGQLPGAYGQALRVAAARELLEQGATSIQAVSSQVGYDDLAYFRALFKRHTGMTPADYRSRFGRLQLDRGELASG
ncbi:transcriptional regulator, AraC family with amidase-like domain [Tistlia consotensis]|uniref:Transcriptional regulator, AraC family with amidase-like domain n=1 Tax=Tistlia consotensis USBA 355 TaxID=560819 RepID=A0A1Y6CQY0_9PROT|nr:helix-turn-helix domain-containing protein [Tistlia consotensis]SMF72384.1 transcriptional regulator, AraC family with amidase-like domain [Tistlia consotensis USBA 355]SNS09026.1 transcriptional regulator, AraC family with amidase-like domain [Tistlia consotensis]